jgi:AcrR family transcriptional regulator
MAAGRPRGFDIDKALSEALEVFLAKGYEGSSLADLTQAMGINPPSLYAAFGSKEGLFRQVLQRYQAERDVVIAHALAAPTAAETVERFLRGSVVDQTLDERTHGCLLVQGALACADQATPIRRELGRSRLTGQFALTERFLNAQTSEDIPRDVDPGGLARYVCTVVHGLAVQAASGASRAELLAVVDMTMKAWPGIVGTQMRADLSATSP